MIIVKNLSLRIDLLFFMNFWYIFSPGKKPIIIMLYIFKDIYMNLFLKFNQIFIKKSSDPYIAPFLFVITKCWIYLDETVLTFFVLFSAMVMKLKNYDTTTLTIIRRDRYFKQTNTIYGGLYWTYLYTPFFFLCSLIVFYFCTNSLRLLSHHGRASCVLLHNA